MSYEKVVVPKEFGISFGVMSKSEIESYFDWFTSIISDRIKVLSKYALDCDLDFSTESLLSLYSWFSKNIELKKLNKREVAEIKDELEGELKNYIEIDEFDLTIDSVSICFDVAIYFGETFKKNITDVDWSYDISNKNYIYYGQPILKKRGVVKDLNPRQIIEVLANKILKGQTKETALVDMFNVWRSIYTR